MRVLVQYVFQFQHPERVRDEMNKLYADAMRTSDSSWPDRRREAAVSRADKLWQVGPS